MTKKKRISLVKVISLIFYGVVFVAALMLILGLKKVFYSSDEIVVNPIEEIPNPQIDNFSKKLNTKYPFTEQLRQRKAEVEREQSLKIEKNQQQAVNIKGTNYRIQVGSFSDKSSADKMRANMILLDYPVHIVISGNQNIVQVGPYTDRDEALSVEKRLKKNGYEPVLKTYK